MVAFLICSSLLIFLFALREREGILRSALQKLENSWSRRTNIHQAFRHERGATPRRRGGAAEASRSLATVDLQLKI